MNNTIPHYYIKYSLIKKLNIVGLPLIVFVILTSFIINNYNSGSDISNDTVLNQALAQTSKNDGGPLVGMNMRGYYTAMSQTRDTDFNFP
jgi:hypothetical protein